MFVERINEIPCSVLEDYSESCQALPPSMSELGRNHTDERGNVHSGLTEKEIFAYVKTYNMSEEAQNRQRMYKQIIRENNNFADQNVWDILPTKMPQSPEQVVNVVLALVDPDNSENRTKQARIINALRSNADQAMKVKGFLLGNLKWTQVAFFFHPDKCETPNRTKEVCRLAFDFIMNIRDAFSTKQ